MNGATQGELMAVLGHRSPAMTKRYTHYAREHLTKLIEKNRLGIATSQSKQESDES
jgi:site-specific recombinase XerD